MSSLQLQVGRRQYQPADAAPRAFECRQSQLTDAALLQSVVRTAAAEAAGAVRVELVAALVPFDLLRWALAPQQRQPPHMSSLQLQVGRRQY